MKNILIFVIFSIFVLIRKKSCSFLILFIFVANREKRTTLTNEVSDHLSERLSC